MNILKTTIILLLMILFFSCKTQQKAINKNNNNTPLIIENKKEETSVTDIPKDNPNTFEEEEEFYGKMLHEGDKIPVISFYDINDEEFNSKNKIVIYSFWFVDCASCKKEIPVLNDIQKYFSNKKNIEFVGVTFNNDSEINSFIKTTPFHFRMLPDAYSIIHRFGIRAYPSTFIVDSKGIIQVQHLGPILEEQKKDIIQKIKSIDN